MAGQADVATAALQELRRAMVYMLRDIRWARASRFRARAGLRYHGVATSRTSSRVSLCEVSAIITPGLLSSPR
jgi:hypothetical protein